MTVSVSNKRVARVTSATRSVNDTAGGGIIDSVE